MKKTLSRLVSLLLCAVMILSCAPASVVADFTNLLKSTFSVTASAKSSAYSDWGAWSAWQDTPISKTEFVDVGTQQVATSANYKKKTVYHYFRYSTQRVADGYGGSDKSGTKYGSNYYTYDFDYELVLPGSNGNYSQGYKYYYTAANGNTVSGKYITVWKCNPFTTLETTNVVESYNYKTQYRSRTRTRTDSYAVAYNANGGKNAPATQYKTNVVSKSGTKYNDLTLTSAVPSKTVTLTFDACGGSVSPASKSYTSAFKKWNTKADGSGTPYDKGGVYKNSADVTLYAQWNDTTYGTLPTPTKTDARFDGWFTSATGGSKVTSATVASSDKKIYAHWTNIYTVKFDANGGTGAPANIRFYDGDTVILPETLPKKSYTVTYNAGGGTASAKTQAVNCTFVKWTTQKDGTGAAYAAKGLYIADGNATIYAQWTNNKLGSIPSATRTGYVFKGWYTAASGGTKVTADTVVSSNMTVYAQWTPITYTVGFNGNGADSGSMADAGMTYDREAALAANAFKKQGYTFCGWNTKADGTGTTYADKASVKNLSSSSGAKVTLYAVWSANPYRITFNGNGATSGSMAEINAKYNVSGTLTANAFSKTGYTFSGWNTKADGTGTTYADKASYKNLTSVSGATINLYAQWTAKSYTVIFDPNGGVCTMPSFSVKYNSTYGKLPSATRTGYTFAGWYTSPAGGSIVNESTKVTITASQTLYAHWTPNKYTVEFNGNGADSGTMSAQSMTYDESKALTSNGFAKSGYVFAGWNTKADGTGTAYADKASVKNLSSSNGAKVTLYAKWLLICKITYNADGGTGAPAEQTVTQGSSLILSSVKPSKKYTITFNANGGTTTPAARSLNCTFAGWKDSAGNAYSAGGSYVFTSHTKLTAKWQNPKAGELPTVSRPSYYFAGWFDSASGGTQYAGTSEIGKSITLYAHWTPVPTFTVSFDANGGTGAPAPQTKLENAALTLTSEIPQKSFTVTFNANGGSTSVKNTEVKCTFTTWNTKADGTGDNYAPDSVFKLNSNTVLHAVWSNGKPGTVPAASRTGYTFAGWYTSPAGGSNVKADTVISSDITVYAHWTANTYTVRFNANGGSGSMAAEKFTYDTAKALTANAFSKKGYSFTGWNTKADGTGTPYADGVSVKNLTSANGGEIVLYAQFTVNSYTVYFDAGKGSTPSASKSVTYGKTYGTLPVPTYTGYVFDGWCTSDGTKITADTTVNTASSHTLSARWLLICNISYNADGGTGAPADFTATQSRTVTLSSTVPAKSFKISYDANGGRVSEKSKNAACVFSGWSDGTNLYKAGGNAVFGGHTVLKASWTNPAAGTLAVPTKDGYHFTGWFTKKSGGTKITSTSVISADTVVYAQWEANSYTVDFRSDGKSVGKITLKYDTKSALSYGKLPEKSGYSFISWKIGETKYADKTEVINLTTENNGTVVCNAVWSKNLTLENTTYSFGNERKDFGYKENYVIPLSSYRLVFGNNTLGNEYYWNSRNQKWGGNCYGMSSTSVMFNNSSSGTKITDYNAAAVEVSDLKVNNVNKDRVTLTQYIEAMQVSQKCTVIQESYKLNQNKLDDMVSHVKESVKTHKLPVIGMFGPEGGHAVTALGIEMVSSNSGRLYIYDCNFPETVRYISLTFDGKGKCTGWSYLINDIYNWGSGKDSCWITYVPYADFEYVWKNRGDKEALSSNHQNIIYTSSANCWVKDENGEALCLIKDGKFTAYQDYVCEMIMAEMNVTGEEAYTYIYIPVDKYTIVNLDTENRDFQTGIIDIDLGAFADTTAKSVTYSASDADSSIYVSADTERGDTFELTMKSSFDEGFDCISLKGTSNGGEINLCENGGSYSYELPKGTDAVLTVDGKESRLESTKKVTSIEVIATPKTEYSYRISKSLDTKGIKLRARYSDGTETTVSNTADMVFSGYNPNKTGSQRISVQYGGAEASYSVNVSYTWWQWIINILLLGFLWY